MFTLQAEPRSRSVKPRCLRRKGMIPGCVYGGGIDQSMSIQVDKNEVKRLLKSKGKGSRVQLLFGNEKVTALFREITRGSAGGEIEHLSFQKLNGQELVSSTAQVTLINTDKIPTYIQQTVFEIPYRASALNLIEKIEIDMGNMRAGDILKVKDLEIAKNDDIELLIDPDSLVLTIMENKRV
ncbi:MAG: 50S ribosomal protein L25 [Clostridiaceae bacterium]|nr:50S ribosomal protein L25 [Clostridiaceae bacterium]